MCSYTNVFKGGGVTLLLFVDRGYTATFPKFRDAPPVACFCECVKIEFLLRVPRPNTKKKHEKSDLADAAPWCLQAS